MSAAPPSTPALTWKTSRAARRRAALDVFHVSAGVDGGAALMDQLGERREVFERMKLALARTAQAGTGFEVTKRRMLAPFDLEAGGARSAQLVFERLGRIALGHEQITVEPFEITVDLFLLHDRFDEIHRRGVTFRRQPRFVLTVHVGEIEVAVVQQRTKMAGSVTRLAPADRPVIQHHHGFTFAQQQISGSDADDAGADDAYVDISVGYQSGVGDARRGALPDGCMAGFFHIEFSSSRCRH